jgi:hypothetical protein
VWQQVRTELHPSGLEIVTVALDVDPEAARPFIGQAGPQHPSLIDSAHVVDELFGIVNVPNGVWIDEEGMIVRPAEPTHPGRNPINGSFRKIDVSTLPPDVAEMLTEARKIKSDPDLSVAMLRDWVERGAESPYALAPDEVIRRSHPRSTAEATAAAEFGLGSTCTATATTTPRSRTGAPRTACIPTTGRTSARRGTSKIPCAKATPTSTTARGSRTSRRSAPRTTTRPSCRSARISARERA